MTAATEVWVQMDGVDVPAGNLYSQRRHGAQSATFVYLPSYLAHTHAYPLDPELPLASGPIQTPVNRKMFNAFADSSPDCWGRMLVERSQRLRSDRQRQTLPSLGEIDYLLGVRDLLRQGAIRFRDPLEAEFLAPDDSRVPPLTELPELLDAAEHVESNTADHDEVTRLLHAGSSVGGARPKAHVRKRNGGIAIAKFPSNQLDTWNVMAWEKVALNLAADCGINVATSELLRLNHRHVLIIDRFDRSNTNRRIGYASALTMLESADGQPASYLDIADIIEEVSIDPTRDLHELWRRMLLFVLISNTDDHLRNHGFLRSAASGWEISPAFDINPDPSSGTKHLTTAITEADTTASVTAILKVAPMFRLNDETARRTIRKIHSIVMRWPEYARQVDLPNHELERLAPAFEHSAADEARAL